MKRLIQNIRKGFTLVELIVVLVILAILAALLIPSLTGYLTRANEQRAILECRAVVQAAQTVATTLYAQAGAVSDGALTKSVAQIAALSETPGTIVDITAQNMSSRIETVRYTAKSGIHVLYDIHGDTLYTIVKEHEKTFDSYLAFLSDADIRAKARELAASTPGLSEVEALQQLVQEEYGGFLNVGNDALAFLKRDGVLQNASDANKIENLVWKPLIMPDGSVLLAGNPQTANSGNSGAANQSYVLYYVDPNTGEGNYYYHRAWGNGKYNSVWVGDQASQLADLVEQLQDSSTTTNTPWQNGVNHNIWVRYEP